MTWRRKAACLGADTELFFPNVGGDNGKEAKAICAVCTVQEECLTDALSWRAADDIGGIRAGVGPKERKRMRRRRRRAA